MSIIVTLIIVVSLIVYVLIHLNCGRNDIVRTHAHKLWYRPWSALFFTGIIFFIYFVLNFPGWPIINSITEDYLVEGLLSLLCAVIWAVIGILDRRAASKSDKIYRIELYRKLCVGNVLGRDRTLPWPYFIDEEGKVRSRVGLVFYRWTMKTLILLVSVAYIAFYVLAIILPIGFLPESGLGLLVLLPLIDFYIYLCLEVETETWVGGGGKIRLPSDFDELWRLYVQKFGNFSVAWKRTLSVEGQKHNRNARNNNVARWDKLMEFVVKDEQDCIVEDCDYATAFTRLESIFDQVEKSGQHVLIALDIPMHFTARNSKTYFDEIADKLREVIHKDFFVYNGASTNETFNNSIVMTPLALISNQGFDKEWMKKIGLITVVSVFDKNISNMYDCRRFSIVLRSINHDYRVLDVTPYRRGLQPSFQSIWHTGFNAPERKMDQFLYSNRQFFIGYNYEDYLERFNVSLKSTPTEPLYSGSELVSIALCTEIEDDENQEIIQKTVTPIHYLELAYTNAIEGGEELDKFAALIKYEILSEDIDKNIVNHLLPIDRIMEDQILYVVFDSDNNAPVAYNKWKHLGYSENFAIVVSKPYLFRDYFNANHSFFESAPFAAIQPCLSKSRVTLAIMLLNMLQNARMEESELRNMLLYYYDSNEIMSVSNVITTLFTTYFTTNLAKSLMTEDEVEFDNEKFVHRIYYSLNLLYGDHDQHYLDMVKVKDEAGNELFEILRDLMEQNYVVGQTHSFSGRPFRIKDYNSVTKTLNVSKVNNSEKDIIFYKPQMQVEIKGDRTPIKEMNPAELKTQKWQHPITGDELYIEFDGFETGVHIDTTAWYEFSKYTVKDNKKTESRDVRNYSNGKVLKISFKFLPKYIDRIEDIRKSLQILLYEAFQSVFTHHAHYLILSSQGEGDPDLPWIFNELHCEDEKEDGLLTYYFIEDAHIDLGLIGALSERENIWYVFRYIYDYLVWLTEGNPLTPPGYEAYLNQRELDKFAFLKYGRDKLPDYFDVDLLINFIKDFFKDGKVLQETVIGRQNQQDTMGACDFCGKEMKNSEMQRLGDGRMRCPDCSVDAIDTEEEFNSLYNRVKELFQTHLGIDFSKIPHTARLISAVELHKIGGYAFSITNGYDVRKVVGLACDRNNDVFYVENGRKPAQTLGIIAHEMTHIWEYNTEDFIKVRETNEDWVEGLAVWTDLYLSEKAGAPDIEQQRAAWLARTDEYGRGLQLIMDTCPDDPYQYIRNMA